MNVTASTLAIALVISAFAPVGRNLLAAGAETGTTSVSLSIDGSRLAIELTTDPGTLLARLDRLAGRRRPPSPSTEPVADAVARRQSELLRQVIVQFDDRVAEVRVDAVTAVPPSGAADDRSSPGVQVRLSASVPDDAGSVRWTYALASAAYPLTVRQGSFVTSETIAGADPSAPVTLIDRRQPGVGRSVWALFVPALFAALLTLRARERRSRLDATSRETRRAGAAL